MYFYNADPGSYTAPLPCGFMSCMVADGLLEGTGRDEKRALRMAEEADRRFRTAHGYSRDTLLERLQRKLHKIG